MTWLNYGTARRDGLAKFSVTVLFVAGGFLLVWSSYIHFHLWHSIGYRNIPTIGPLFVAQSIAGLVLGLGVVAVRRVWAAILGAGFALSTVAGFLVSVNYGLFGFKDYWAAPYAREAFIIEISAAVVLLVAGGLCLLGRSESAERRNRGPAA